ncbi:hypothetical protein NL676_029617 [Syzygium grande]|nr:hypothetical protein NL676_029617 [Syzygium grande]
MIQLRRADPPPKYRRDGEAAANSGVMAQAAVAGPLAGPATLADHSRPPPPALPSNGGLVATELCSLRLGILLSLFPSLPPAIIAKVTRTDGEGCCASSDQ